MSITSPYKSYPGSKSGNGTYQQIINLIPQCRSFIDVFVGNAGLIKHLALPGLTVINDIDALIIHSYKQLSVPVIVENLHYADLIDKYSYLIRSDSVWYFDPPYLMATRSHKKKLYKYDWSINDHKQFLSRVLTVKSNCMISHYQCTLYNKLLRSWNKHTFQSMTRGGVRTECIYFNYPKPATLQDFRYCGTNFIDRQRIKRKITRLTTKLNALQPQERAAVIDAIKKLST